MRESKEKNTKKHENSNKSKAFSFLSNNIEDELALKQWKHVVQQMSIDGQWFKKQIPLIILIVIGTITYITCRYQAQQEIILEEQLKLELQDWKYRSVTRSSELTLKSRQSQVESSLKFFGDSTLKVSTVAPYTLNISKTK
jgi:hypothetical protein